MTGVFRQMLGQLESWLDRVVESDPRFICAVCDDRFANRGQGVEHVWRCHPEYEGVLLGEIALEGHLRPAPVRVPSRLPSTQMAPVLPG